MDISKLSAKELEELATRIPNEIQKRKQAEKEKVLQEVIALAATHGFTLEELTDSKAVVTVQKKRGSRKPARVKYRHPQQSELTWTGRGRKPAWIAEWIASGNALEALAT